MRPFPFNCLRTPVSVEPWLFAASAVAFSFAATAQEFQAPPLGLPYDWSHRNLIYVNPQTRDDAEWAGTLDTWTDRANDPRFVLQFEKKQQAQPAGSGITSALKIHAKKPKNPPAPTPGVDWSESLVGGSVAPLVFPAKWNFDVTAAPSCGSSSTAGDFVVFPINVAGSKSQPTIVAYNNLYVGPASGQGYCGTNGGTSDGTPNVLWAYNTTNAIQTSPVLSSDGSAVAWVESGAILKVLRWRINDGTTGTFPNRSIASDLTTTSGQPSACVFPNPTAPCIATLSLSGTGLGGSLFVDYASDTGYITDGSGNFFKVKDVFGGSAAPSQAWSGARSSGKAKKLLSPVYDGGGRVFAVDVDGNIFQVNDVANGSLPAAPTSIQVASAGTVDDGLIVTLGASASDTRVIVSAGQGAGTFNNSSVVVQASVNPLATVATVRTSVSTYATANLAALPNGAFANDGSLYVVGVRTANPNRPVLFRVGFTGVDMNTSTSGGPWELVNAGANPSPVTTFYNTTTGNDWLFIGVSNKCAPGGTSAAGNAGCMQSYDITSGFPTAVSAVVAESGGTSGIVVDNVSSQSQASSIYFGTLSGKTAVKLTQSGLQ